MPGATPLPAAPAPLPTESAAAAVPPPATATAAAASAATPAQALPGYAGALPAAPSGFSAGPLAAGLFLAALAAAAFVLARRRRGVPRLVEVLEQTSLGPKRALVVARLGDELLVLGSSEGGIALLATRPAAAAAHAPVPAPAPQPGPAGRGGPLAGAAIDLLARLKRRAPPSFDAALAESLEDAELRRKLAQGQRGRVP